MTEEKMREALVKIRDMTGVRGLDPMKREIWNIAHHALIPALSTTQEAGEVSRSQTAQALEEAAQVADEQATQSAESYKEALKANDPIGMTCSGARERMALRIAKRIRALQQDSGEVSRSQTAPPSVRSQALEEAAKLVIDRLHDYRAHGSIDFPDSMPTELAHAIRALSLPAPDAGWRTVQCRWCYGRGHVSGDPEGAPVEACDVCGGTKRIQIRALPLPAPPVGDGSSIA